MLHELSGGSPKSASDYYGRTIKRADFGNNLISLQFDDGVKIQIWDDGQSCCENRYMTSDDKFEDLVGQKLVSIKVKAVNETHDEENYNDHDVAFLEIQGDKSAITVAAHNEHNGYYGGFGLSIDEVKNAEE